MQNSTIFITGGAGFVGSYIVEKLLLHNPKEIRILDNLLRGSRANMESFLHDPRVVFVEGDIRDPELLEWGMQGADYCFHLAALRINRCAADQLEGYEVMIRGLFEVIESAKNHQLKKLIYSSSASVYGMAGQFPTPESEAPYDNKTFYGAAKLLGEQLLRSYHDMHGLNFVALRYFNIYGPRMDIEGKYTEVMVKWLDCIREGRPPLIFGDGLTSLDCIYIEDVAEANLAALTSPVTNQVFNIGSGQEICLKDLLELMLKINHSNLTPGHREESTVNPVRRRLADISKAQKLLGFSPKTDLETGLKLLSEWYFEQNGNLS
ncbi:MAG: NAD-dependent epimerase/dehydratase family protein [Bacteroidia bacterium]|nr:NAD-dependent epimerase/dehydratase family protein [Bacteroidia bacterium]